MNVLLKISEFEENLKLLEEKLTSLRKAKILETHIDEKFRLEKLIIETEEDIETNYKLLNKLSAPSNKHIAEVYPANPTTIFSGKPESNEHLPVHNLPSRNYSKFIGRKPQLEELINLMSPKTRHFLVIIDGIGGVGKSALALELAYYFLENYNTLPESQRFELIFWISAKLTSLTANGIQKRAKTLNSIDDFIGELGVVLNISNKLDEDIDKSIAFVKQALINKRTLLIVDNLETVDDEALLSFLRELPEPTKAVVTSRHRVDVSFPIRLTGMPYVDACELINLELHERKLEITPMHIESLYRKTGGIPLAIVWSIGLISLGYEPESVLMRLGSSHDNIAHFCFLETLGHILHTDCYKLLLSLAFFDSSVNRVMIGHVAAFEDDAVGRDDSLAKLVQLSLLNKTSDRFFLLPLTKNFAIGELEKNFNQAQYLRTRWINYLLKFSDQYTKPDWMWRDLNDLKKEGSHLVTLSAWCQQNNRLDILLRIIPALCSYYDLTSQWSETIKIGKLGLEYSIFIDDKERIIFIYVVALAWVLGQQGREKEAEDYMIKALTLADQEHLRWWQCETRIKYSQVLRRMKDYTKATNLCTEAFKFVPELPEDEQNYVRADILYELGKISRDMHDWESAKDYFLQSSVIFRHDKANQIYNPERAWGLISNLGFVEQNIGNIESAERLYTQCIQFFRNSGGAGYMATLLIRLGSLEYQRSNTEVAINYITEAVMIAEQLNLHQEHVEGTALLRQLKSAKSHI